MLFADGHAESLQVGSDFERVTAWGGKLAFYQSQARLLMQQPILRQVQTALKRDDERAAMRLLTGHRGQAREALRQVLSLWKLNIGNEFDPTVERWGWRLGQLWQAVGKSKCYRN